MTTKSDVDLIHETLLKSSSALPKHHEVSLALQALERLARTVPSFECGRCSWLHDKAGEEIPEHSPRCTIRLERASAWDSGYDQGYVDGRDVVLADKGDNPHRR